MSKRFTYSRSFTSVEGVETYTADQFDSFDEAKRVVDRGIHDRKLELAEKYPGNNLGGSAPRPILPPPTGGPVPAPMRFEEKGGPIPTNTPGGAAGTDKNPI